MPSRNAARSSVTKKNKRAVVQKKRRLYPLSLLILECDANKLTRQSLSVANELNQIICLLPAKLKAEVALINSAVDLQDKFIYYKEKYSSIKVIVVVAHSNRNVVSIAPDMVLKWDAFARWVAPFKPQQMVFIACEAGQYPSTRTLFDEIPKLAKIYASPIKTTKEQAEIIKLLVPYILLSKKQDDDLIRLGQMWNFLNNGGIILRCSRRNTEWNQLLQFIGGLM
jgi:hypothetical protein